MKKTMTYFIDHHFNESLHRFPVYCESKCGDPNMRGPHAHHGFEFQFSFSSKGLMLVEEQQYTVHPGKVFIIRPHAYHVVLPEQASVNNRAIFSVEDAYLDQLLQVNRELAEAIQSWFPDDDVNVLELQLTHKELYTAQSLLEQLEQELQLKQKGWELYVKTLVMQIILLLSRAGEVCNSKKQTSVEMKDIAIQISDYLKNHCCDSLDMATVAAKFHVSKSYMFKIFKAHTGYTPYQFIIQHRIQHAKRMLKAGRESITQISTVTGFNDASHFIRTFKEWTGMTPGEYKMNLLRSIS